MVFDGLKPLKNIEKQTFLFRFRSFKKNNEKSMPKGFPKVMKIGSKWSPGAPRINLFLVFIDFWSRRKKLDFSMTFRANQKTRKIDPWSAECSKKTTR